MHSVKISDIEECFKSLKPKFPIVDSGCIAIDIGTGWLIISEKKFNEEILSKIHY